MAKKKKKSSRNEASTSTRSANLESFSPSAVHNLINSIRLAEKSSSPNPVPKLKLTALTTGGSTSSEPAGEKFSLVTSDGKIHRVSVKAGECSEVIKKLMGGNKEEVILEKHSSEALDPVICYFEWVDDGRMDEFRRLKASMGELLDGLVMALELEIGGMVDEVSGMIAAKMKDKSVEWVRDAFGIVGDLTAREEADIREQYPWAFEGVVDQEDEGVQENVAA